MTASNHVVTGMVIGTVVSNPFIAVPLAFFAHFALDALPHFGLEKQNDSKFLYYLSTDAGIAAGLLLSVFILSPSNWPVIIASGIACASPDLMWLPDWLRLISGKKPKKPSLIKKIHAKVQWAEKYTWWAITIEAVWFFVMLGLLIVNLY